MGDAVDQRSHFVSRLQGSPLWSVLRSDSRLFCTGTQNVEWAKKKEDLKPWVCGTADEPGLRALFFGNSTARKRGGVFYFAAGVDPPPPVATAARAR